MFRTLCVRGLILILLFVLGAPLASAAGSREPEGLSVRGVVSALWQTLTDLASLLTSEDGGGGSTTTDDGGPIMDPNGKPKGP